MKIYKYPQREQWTELTARPHLDHSQLQQTVSSVLSDVRERGDEAVLDYEERFDHVRLTQLAVTAQEMAEAESLVSTELKDAIEQGQNFSAKYRDSITVSLMVRQAICFLPEAMRLFEQTAPDVQILPKFQYEGGMDSFLKGDADILFSLRERTRQLSNVIVHDLFDSRIYLIARRDDPLAEKNLITASDLYDRTLMVGGGSPTALKAVQHRLISTGKINYFNSADHDTTLTNVAAGKGICLAPGFLNDHSGQFAWIPFDCEEYFECVLCTHKNDARQSVAELIALLKKLYKEAVAFPL